MLRQLFSQEPSAAIAVQAPAAEAMENATPPSGRGAIDLNGSRLIRRDGKCTRMLSRPLTRSRAPPIRWEGRELGFVGPIEHNHISFRKIASQVGSWRRTSKLKQHAIAVMAIGVAAMASLALRPA